MFKDSNVNAVARSTCAAFAFVSKGGVFAWANPAFADIFGKNPGDFEGKSLGDFNLDLPFGGILTQLEIRGTASPFDVTTVFEGKVYGLCGFVEPVDDGYLVFVEGQGAIKKAENKSGASWQTVSRVAGELVALLDTIPDYISLTDDSFRFVRVNKSLAKLCGCEPKELIGKRCYEVLHKQGTPWVSCPQKVALRDNKVFTAEVCDPQIGIPLLVTCAPFKDSTGKLKGTIHVARDISDLKSAERALKESEAKLRATIKALPDILFEVDDNGRVLDYNAPNPEELYMPPEAFMGKTLPELLPPNISNPIMDAIKLAANTGNRTYATYSMPFPTGEKFYEISVGCHNFSGSSNRFVALARDITIRKTLEAQLRHSQKMEAIGTLAGGIAHDFNNILMSILGYTELSLELAEGKPQLKENLNRIYKGINKAAKIIEQILTFGRQDKPNLTTLSINEITTDLIDLMRSTMPSTIEVATRYPDADLYVLADASHLHQVLINLITNARDALVNQKGKIEVCVQKATPSEVSRLGLEARPYVSISVSDNGTGMTSDILSRVFDPYFTTKDVGKGSGLGLSVVHGIISSLGGSIVAESSPGRGSRFCVFLPMSEGAHAIEAHGEQNAHDLTKEASYTVMFVDDEPELALLGEELIKVIGHDAVSFSDPTLALKAYSEAPSKWDLVITDQTMPRLTGKELTQEILKVDPKARVVIYTGHSDLVDEEIAGQIGATAYLAKPVNLNKLAETINSICSSPR